MNKITKIVKRRETLKKISLLLLTVFIIFVIAETLCILFYDESVNYDEIVREEVKRFALRGNEIEKKVYADADTGMFYRVDDKQLDKERYMRFDPLSVSEHAENETYRIAILGDSFARCGGLTNDDCDKYGLHVQLQNTLNKHVTVNDVNKFEVLSFADGGLNTYQEFLIFRDVVLSYSP
ncbi:MAG: hypothetical protein KAS04_06865, partial [Candidatus Aenigmarchaeota archaeon]|nr:hypothetical protein [Candidatus Aenigmarchaeota archaeon]